MKLIKVQENVNASVGSSSTGGFPISLFVDNETKVEYFVLNYGNGNMMCPRLNADGKPVVRRTSI